MGIESNTLAIRAGLARAADCMTWSDERLFAVAPTVSSWSVAQQLHHTLLAARYFVQTIETLEAGTDNERIQTGGSPSIPGRAVLLAGRIPRGRGEAPETSLPEPSPSRGALLALLRGVESEVAALADRALKLKQVEGVIPHHLLGGFSAVQWWRFLRIHTEHHLALVDDIDRRRGLAAPACEPTRPMTSPS